MKTDKHRTVAPKQNTACPWKGGKPSKIRKAEARLDRRNPIGDWRGHPQTQAGSMKKVE